MKLILVLTFLALICAARSAPAASTNDRTIVQPTYEIDEEEVVQDDPEDSEEDVNTTTTTTTTVRTVTRRSSYVFPASTSTRRAARQPWETPRTTTVDENKIDSEDTDFTADDTDINFLKEFRAFTQKLMKDVKKFLKKLTGFDIIKFIKNLFSWKNDD